MIVEALQTIVSDPSLLSVIGWTVAVAMTVGWLLDNGLTGYRRSLSVIIPFILLTTIIRIDTMPNIDTFVDVIFFFLISIVYVVGLFLGHVVIWLAIRHARKQVKETYNYETLQAN